MLVTISYIRLYIPTMLVIGLHGWILPPHLIIFCDWLVYSEFVLHPAQLLSSSIQLREEILHQQLLPLASILVTIFCIFMAPFRLLQCLTPKTSKIVFVSAHDVLVLLKVMVHCGDMPSGVQALWDSSSIGIYWREISQDLVISWDFQHFQIQFLSISPHLMGFRFVQTLPPPWEVLSILWDLQTKMIINRHNLYSRFWRY